jgi:putative heme degradation protein
MMVLDDNYCTSDIAANIREAAHELNNFYCKGYYDDVGKVISAVSIAPHINIDAAKKIVEILERDRKYYEQKALEEKADMKARHEKEMREWADKWSEVLR